MRRLEQLYVEASELLHAGDPRAASNRVGAALLELDGIWAKRGGPSTDVRREVSTEDAQPEALEAASERLRILAHEVRLEIERLEADRRRTAERRRLTRAFGARDGQGLRVLDRSA